MLRRSPTHELAVNVRINQSNVGGERGMDGGVDDDGDGYNNQYMAEPKWMKYDRNNNDDDDARRCSLVVSRTTKLPPPPPYARLSLFCCFVATQAAHLHNNR